MIILAAVVAGVTALFILGPLLGWGSAPAWSAGDEERALRDDHLARRREILASIKDLEMEFAVGKLTREDFERTREELTKEAVEQFRRTEPDGAA